MRQELDIVIRNSEELEKYVDENKDIRFPENDIRIEFEPKESEIRDIEGENVLLCTFKNGGVEKRFDFNGRDIMCWGDCVLKDFNGRNFTGGSFVGRDFIGQNFTGWTFEGRNILYFSVFITHFRLSCSSIFGRFENSIHKSLCEKIEFIPEEKFEYGLYSYF